MAWRVVAWGNRYFSKPFAAIRFQPILYLFIWGAGIRLGFETSIPTPSFDSIIGDGFYEIWIGLTIVSPVLALLAWFLVQKRSGRARFIGMWLNLAANIGVLTALLSYHVVAVQSNALTESRVFSRYIVGATTMFVIGLTIRDIWTLALTERLARMIHRGDA